MSKTAFIGHRHIFDNDLEERLYKAIEQMIKNGCKVFTMGTYVDFDRLAFSVCRKLRKIYDYIEIEVVFSNLNYIKPIIFHNDINSRASLYSDVKTVVFDIEDVYFKRRIIESNKQMIENCENLICYVDVNYRLSSGARTLYNYAKKKGLHIVNLYNLWYFIQNF